MVTVKPIIIIIVAGSLNDVELQNFVDEQTNWNTKQKTDGDVNDTSSNNTMRLEELPPPELLGHFFVSIRNAQYKSHSHIFLVQFRSALNQKPTQAVQG